MSAAADLTAALDNLRDRDQRTPRQGKQSLPHPPQLDQSAGSATSKAITPNRTAPNHTPWR